MSYAIPVRRVKTNALPAKPDPNVIYDTPNGEYLGSQRLGGADLSTPEGKAAVRGAALGAQVRASSRYRGGGQLAVTTGLATAGRTYHLARRAPFSFSSVSIFVQNHTGSSITIDSLGAAAAANLTDPKLLGATWVGDTTDLVVPAAGVAMRKLDVRSVATDDGIGGYPVAGRIYSAGQVAFKTHSDSGTLAALYPQDVIWTVDAGTDYAASNQSAMPNAATNAGVNLTMSLLPHYNKPVAVVLIGGDSLDAFEYTNAGGTYARFDSPIVNAIRQRQLTGAAVDYVSAAKASDGYATFATRLKAYVDLLLPDIVCIPVLTPNGLTGTAPADANGVWAVWREAQATAEYCRSKGALVLWRTAWPSNAWPPGDARLAALLEINQAARDSGDLVVDVYSIAGGSDGRYASASYLASDGSNLHYSTDRRDAAASLYVDAFSKIGL